VIHDLKFRFHTRLIPFLRPYLREAYTSHYAGLVDALVPVPLHWWRRRWREFNQAELLARALSQSVDVPVQEDTLVRSRYTTPQSRIRGGRKRRNVSGAFQVRKGRSVGGKRILLIDDVYTSGNTVNECARILKEAGASQVSVLTVARVVRG
jgi:ComF family protein